MPLLNGVPLPHEGRARYPLADSRMVLIDLDDKHVVIEVHKDHLAELPGLDRTFMLGAGDLRFFYYLKTPDVMRFLNSMNIELDRNLPTSPQNDHRKIENAKALGSLAFAKSTSMNLEQLEEAINRVRKTGHLPDGSRSCLLCSSTCPNEAMFVGVFVADREHQSRIGYSEEKLAKGGRRFILYQLCPTCYKCPTRNESVETKIMSQMSVQ